MARRDSSLASLTRWASPPDKVVAGWPTWGGDPGGTRHSPLAQIDRANVRFLERAWSYRTGHVPGSVPNLPRVAFQATPVR